MTPQSQTASIVWPLPSMGYSFFTWQSHNVSWLHNVDVILLLCPFYILDILCIQVKACVCYFHQIFIVLPNKALQKLWKKLFISSKKLFSFSRYSNLCISDLPSFPTCRPLLRGWSKINLKVHDVMNLISLEGKKVWLWNFVHRWSIR